VSQQVRRQSEVLGSFLQRYLNKIPFVRADAPAWLVLGLVSLAVVLTGYLSWLATGRWGHTIEVQAQETQLVNGQNLKNLWFPAKDELTGYRQDGWQLTLLRWSLKDGSAQQPYNVDLDKLTPPDLPPSVAANASTDTQNPYRKLPNGQYRRPTAPNSAPALPAQSAPVTGAAAAASRTTQPILVAVSQSLSLVAWAWKGKLYWTSVTPASDHARNHTALLAPVAFTSSASGDKRPPINSVHSIDLPAGATPTALTLVRAEGVIVQEAGGRLLLYDLKNEKLLREETAATPCVVSVTTTHALLGCRSSDLSLLDFPPTSAERKTFALPPQVGKDKDVAFMAVALSADGVAAAATDRGTVWVCKPEQSGVAVQASCEEWQSPGVAQSLVWNADQILVGGGFRGIFLLRQHKPAELVVQDTTGTTLLVWPRTKDDSGAPSGESLFFANRELAAKASLTESTVLNNRGIGITVAWLGFWVVFLAVIPATRLWVEEIRKRREIGLRSEQERSLQRVPTANGETAPPIPLPDPPDRLVKACLAGDCVAYVGAGVGAQAGLPTWRPLIQAALTEVSKKGLIEAAQLGSLQEAFIDGQLDLVADGLVDALRGQESMLRDFLTQQFLRRDIRPTRVHDLLRSLNLSAVLTTNFDDLLDTVFKDRVETVYTHQDAEKLLAALSKRQFFLLKLYGSLERPGSVLFAPSQYLEAMARNLLYSRFMEALFSSRTLLFIGASLEGIESYLTGIRFPTSLPQRHFALVVAQGGAWQAKADLLARRFGIQVLAYTPGPGYPEVEEFVRKLSARVAAEGTQASMSARAISRIKTVTLENIGPFDRLELDLDRNWTILLGDNGVGKSTILRAIAVGIAGPDAAEYARRLVKAGREKDGARITLETETGKLYITEIRRGDKTIVESRPSRPLEPEGWLAIGFPPLRSFTSAPATELPSKGLKRLTSEDLMPLIRGEIDPRLDKLKNWIIDLDYRDKNQRASHRSLLSYFHQGDMPNQFVRLLDQFFEVIRRLTPGLKLGNVEIDADKKEVRVETDDGVLPIELVSQGTQSLLGWVGVLLQRLNDFYGADSDDRQNAAAGQSLSLLDEYALVLMDEIDAHMHPRWQRLIVPSLKQLFPNVQFIVTTHSPLVVAGLERREVRVARRVGPDEPHAGHVVVEWPRQKLKGLRADQILTGGSLFNLDSTLAPDLDAERKRYTELAAKNTLTTEEQAELESLADSLQIRLPAPYEREVARVAFENMQEALELQLSNLPPEKRKKLMEEAKVQAQENVTGSRRP
jgi:hypothetical protein